MKAPSCAGRVAVIVTVLNEGRSIGTLMDSLVAQTRRADEVVVVDGGSRDETVAVLKSYCDRLPLRVVIEPGLSIGQGRNRAIEIASADVIASTDAGVRLSPGWLRELTQAFARAECAPQVVSGFFVADPQNLFETAMGATILPSVEEIDPSSFLPSSRSIAFSRRAWEAAGGYPTWLDYCEDLVFDLRLRERCGVFGWAPDAVVYFRPRSNLGAFFRQYYRYARGDGKADLWRSRHAIRYITYGLVLPGILLLGLWHHPLWLVLVGLGVAVYCRTPWRRLGRTCGHFTKLQRLHAAALLPVVRAVGDVAKMAGYPVGWCWRIRNWHRPEIHWR